jgi:hypothetical protein
MYREYKVSSKDFSRQYKGNKEDARNDPYFPMQKSQQSTMYQPKSNAINDAYYDNDPYDFNEVVVQHETHKSVYNPKKHNMLDAVHVETQQDIHRPRHPAREVSQMHDYSEEAKQILKVFKGLEPEMPETEEEYLNRFRAVAPEVFDGME